MRVFLCRLFIFRKPNFHRLCAKDTSESVGKSAGEGKCVVVDRLSNVRRCGYVSDSWISIGGAFSNLCSIAYTSGFVGGY